MSYNFAADSFHTKKLCSRLSSSEVRFFYGNRPFCVFETPLGDLGATYDDHLRLIVKRVVDFLLALIELFSLCVTAEALRTIIGSKSAILLQLGPVDPKFQVEGVVPHQPFFFSENWAKCSFIWYINLDRSFYRFVTIHTCDGRTVRRTDGQTDGRTDGQTEFSSVDRVCIPCSAVTLTKKPWFNRGSTMVDHGVPYGSPWSETW